MRTSTEDRNGALQGRGDRLNSGFVRFYAGVVPVSADAPLSGNTLIAECALGNPACATPTAGTMAFNTIGSAICVGSGAPTFARFLRSDGTTAVADMDVPEELVLTKTIWAAGEPFPAPSVIWSQAAE
jgi:hypothetical protein